MRTSLPVLLILAFLVSVPSGWAQRSQSEGRRRGQAPTGGTATVPLSATDTGFAMRLGATVGAQMPPGVGNINSPGTASSTGLQPLPTHVQPMSNWPAGYPNINSPGGTPGMHAPQPSRRESFPHQHKGMRRHRSPKGANVVFFSAPLSVPYVVITEAPSAIHSGVVTADPGAYDVPSAPSEPAHPTVTVLALKDGTAALVVDYWLEGERLWYETSGGSVSSIFLDQLDLVLTQRLNRERGVRFILESRP